MLTSKQRSQLRAIANDYETIIQIGKNSVPAVRNVSADGSRPDESSLSENVVKQVSEALSARELIKIRVLNNSGYSAKEAAAELGEKTGSEIVQVIGTRFILYKRHPSPEKRKITFEK